MPKPMRRGWLRRGRISNRSALVAGHAAVRDPDAHLEPSRYEQPKSPLARRFEQFDRVAVGVFDLDLLAAGPCLHVVPEMEAGFLQGVNERGKISHPKH